MSVTGQSADGESSAARKGIQRSSSVPLNVPTGTAESVERNASPEAVRPLAVAASEPSRSRDSLEEEQYECSRVDRSFAAERIFPSPYCDVESRYVLLETLGSGSTSVVRRCVDRNTGAEWACKTIPKSRSRSGADVAGLRREVAAMELVGDHMAVARLHDVVEDEDSLHLIMEIGKGGDLYRALVAGRRYKEGNAARVVRSLLSVLTFMHSKRVMHRDLKPENIVLITEDLRTRVKVIDFGSATPFTAGVSLEEVVGSAEYIAPEVIRRQYGPPADLWSVGIILYTLLCGRPPFCSERRKDIFAQVLHATVDMEWGPWRRVPEEAKDLVRSMLDQDVRKRITAAQAKRHPWIQTYCRDHIPAPLPHPYVTCALRLPSLPFHSPRRLSREDVVVDGLAEEREGGVAVRVEEEQQAEVEAEAVMNLSVARCSDGTPNGRPFWEPPQLPEVATAPPESYYSLSYRRQATTPCSQTSTPKYRPIFPKVSRTSSAPIIATMHVVDWDGREEEVPEAVCCESPVRRGKSDLVSKVQDVVGKPIGLWLRGRSHGRSTLRTAFSNASSILSSPSSTPRSIMGTVSPNLIESAMESDIIIPKPR